MIVRIGLILVFIALFLSTFFTRFSKTSGYIIRYLSLFLVFVLLFLNVEFIEGLTDEEQGKDSSNKDPSNTPSFNVNSTPSFALLGEGEMLNPPKTPAEIAPNWYQPDSFRVPFLPSDTQDQIFMNKSTNLSQVTTIQDTPYKNAGFCSEQANFPLVKESKCNALSNETCASTECCVLLGGEKCVAGNEQGPLIQTNYSNFLIKNRDFYYYQGKCYGYCDNQ